MKRGAQAHDMPVTDWITAICEEKQVRVLPPQLVGPMPGHEH